MLSMRCAAAEFDAQAEHVADLLVDHGIGQAEFRNLRADHAARLGIAVEHDAFVAQRRQIARHGQRRRAGADQRDALAVLRFGGDGSRSRMSSLKSAATRFKRQIATGSGLALAFAISGEPSSTRPRRHAGSHGRSQVRPEDAGKNVGLPVDEVGVAVMTRGDQPDVFGNGRMGRACPLTIDDFVEIVRVCDIRRLQRPSLQWPARSHCCVARIPSRKAGFTPGPLSVPRCYACCRHKESGCRRQGLVITVGFLQRGGESPQPARHPRRYGTLE